MPTESFGEAMRRALGTQLITVAGAVVLLLLGWAIGLVAAAGTRRALSMAQVNRRLAPAFGRAVDLELLASRLVFWFVLLVALVAAFNTLDLQMASARLAAMVGGRLGVGLGARALGPRGRGGLPAALQLPFEVGELPVEVVKRRRRSGLPAGAGGIEIRPPGVHQNACPPPGPAG